jgi:MFS family permease
VAARRARTGDPESLWRNGDFVRLWGAGTVSYFGSFITRTALPFAAILVLDSGPVEIAALRGLELVAGLGIGLVAGAWVDRLRRRPIMVAADLGRAALLGSIPLAATAGALFLPQLLVVAFVAALLTTFFEVAEQSYLPTVVPRSSLVAANSALTASASVAEFTGFSVSGFLIQLLTAPVAIAIDALTFVGSALLLATIRRPEPRRPARTDRKPMLREIRAGLGIVASSPTLRALAAAHGATHLLWGVFGTSYLLFATRDLSLGPAAIGLIAGLGGLGSFVGAASASRVLRRLGVGPTILLGLVGFTAGNALIPLAPSGAVLVAAALLVVQQVVGDSAATVYDIVEVSLTQSLVESRVLGRVNATIRTFTILLQLGGTVVGALVAETLGLRVAMFVGLLGGVLAFALVWASPIRAMRGQTMPAPESALGEELPITE